MRHRVQGSWPVLEDCTYLILLLGKFGVTKIKLFREYYTLSVC